MLFTEPPSSRARAVHDGVVERGERAVPLGKVLPHQAATRDLTIPDRAQHPPTPSREPLAERLPPVLAPRRRGIVLRGPPRAAGSDEEARLPLRGARVGRRGVVDLARIVRVGGDDLVEDPHAEDPVAEGVVHTGDDHDLAAGRFADEEVPERTVEPHRAVPPSGEHLGEVGVIDHPVEEANVIVEVEVFDRHPAGGREAERRAASAAAATPESAGTLRR